MKEELLQRIFKWEAEAGESFNDYFTTDNTKEMPWAFWLLGKGYKEFALELIKGYLEDSLFLAPESRESRFEVFQEYDGDSYNEENYEKNMELVAEFLSSVPHYMERVEEFFLRN